MKINNILISIVLFLKLSTLVYADESKKIVINIGDKKINVSTIDGFYNTPLLANFFNQNYIKTDIKLKHHAYLIPIKAKDNSTILDVGMNFLNSDFVYIPISTLTLLDKFNISTARFIEIKNRIKKTQFYEESQLKKQSKIITKTFYKPLISSIDDEIKSGNLGEFNNDAKNKFWQNTDLSKDDLESLDPNKNNVENLYLGIFIDNEKVISYIALQNVGTVSSIQSATYALINNKLLKVEVVKIYKSPKDIILIKRKTKKFIQSLLLDNQ